MAKRAMADRLGRRIFVASFGTAAAAALLLLAPGARADELHCTDKEIKSAVLDKLGHTRLATPGLTLHTAPFDDHGTVTADAKVGGPATVIVASPTSSKTLEVSLVRATDSDVDVLVCVYGRGPDLGKGAAPWSKIENPYDLHGSFGDPAPSNKVLSTFSLSQAAPKQVYSFVNRLDSSMDDTRMVAVILTAKKGSKVTDAKISVGLNAAPAAPPPAQPANDSIIGVDRGAFFSSAAVQRMLEFNVAPTSSRPTPRPLDVPSSNGLCLSAVKRALLDTGTLVQDADGTREAKDFAAVMRDPTKVRGYRELTGSKETFAYKDLPGLKKRLPVGTILVYRNNDLSDPKASPSPVHGHIDMVATYNGQKSLLSDHIAKWGSAPGIADGWGWLAGRERNVDMAIFVPTEEGHRIATIDMRPAPAPKPKRVGLVPRGRRADIDD